MGWRTCNNCALGKMCIEAYPGGGACVEHLYLPNPLNVYDLTYIVEPLKAWTKCHLAKGDKIVITPEGAKIYRDRGDYIEVEGI